MGIEELKASKAAAKASIESQMAELDRIERTTGPSGAIPLEPKQQMLRTDHAQKLNPDLRLRWVNIANSEKAQMRMLEGYRRLSDDMGGRQLGNLALFGIDRRKYEEKVANIERLNRERLSSHRSEMENTAEQVAKILRDRHGIRVNAERLLINEEG